MLRVTLSIEQERVLPKMRAFFKVQNSAWGGQLAMAIDDGFERLLLPSVETERPRGPQTRNPTAPPSKFLPTTCANCCSLAFWHAHRDRHRPRPANGVRMRGRRCDGPAARIHGVQLWCSGIARRRSKANT